MTKRGDSLELAVLGLLRESPMHGYQLRKRVTALLGWGRVLSYGSLYPRLKQMLREGHIAEQPPGTDELATGRRGRIVYTLTPQGGERFTQILSTTGPSAWDDDTFGVRFAFFAAATTEARIRVLEGRRSRLEERLDGVRTALARSRERLDSYTLELQRHQAESVEREVGWLNQLIASERTSQQPPTSTSPPQNLPQE